MRGPGSASVARSVLQASLVILAVVFVVLLAWQLRHLVLLIFLATLVAAALHSPTLFLEQHRFPRLAAVLAVYLGVLTVLTLVLVLIVPPLAREIASLVEDVPELLDRLRGAVAGLVNNIARGNGERAIDTLTEGVTRIDWGPLLQLPLTLAEVLINLLLVLALSAFMLVERDRTRDWLLRFVEPRRGRQLLVLSRRALARLGAYVRGQLLVMTVVGVGSVIGMVLLGVPFALPLGVLAFLAEAVPFAGPWVAGAPMVLVAALESPITGLLMLVWFVVLQQLEGLVITPLVQGHVVAISPMVVLIAVVAGVVLGGLIGAIIAIPIVAVIDVLIEDVILPLRRRQTDDDSSRGEPGRNAASP